MTFATYAPRQPAHPTRTGVRRTINPRILVYHTSEGAEGVNSAEALARFLQSPRTATNVASYHYIVDTDDIIPVVPDDRVAYANAGANHDGLTICYPGTIRQTSAEWLDDISRAYHEQVARWTVDKCRQYGIPIVRLTDAELVMGGRGIVDHGAVSRVYKRSTHTDCGPSYPWDHVLGRALELAADTTEDDDEVSDMTDDQAAQLTDIQTAVHQLAAQAAAAPVTVRDSDGNLHLFYRHPDGTLVGKFNDDRPYTLGGQITDAVCAIAGPDKVVDVFAYTPDGGLSGRRYNGRDWDGWYQVAEVRDRSVIEVMVLVFTFVVAFTLVASGVTVAIIEIKDPEADTNTIVQSLISLVSGILGALLGLIAGKSTKTNELHQRPGGDVNGLDAPP